MARRPTRTGHRQLSGQEGLRLVREGAGPAVTPALASDANAAAARARGAAARGEAGADGGGGQWQGPEAGRAAEPRQPLVVSPSASELDFENS